MRWIEPAGTVDLAWAEDEVAPEWNRLRDVDGVVMWDDEVALAPDKVGMATHRDGELTWLWVDRWHLGEGIATALVEAIPGPLRVTITNADLHQLRWLQRRGFRLTGAKPMAFPRRDQREQILIRDELYLERR